MRTSTSPATSRSGRPRSTTWPCTRPTLKTCTRRRRGYFSCLSNGPRTCPCSPTCPSETRWDAASLSVVHPVEGDSYNAPKLHNTVGHRLFSVVWSWDPIMLIKSCTHSIGIIIKNYLTISLNFAGNYEQLSLFYSKLRILYIENNIYVWS